MFCGEVATKSNGYIHVNLEEEWVHLKSGRSTWGLRCYEGVQGDDRRMLHITPVQPRTMDPPRQNNIPSQHIPTPPGHYSNHLDNIITVASRLAAFPVEGESPVAVEMRRARDLLQTALNQQ